MDFRDLVRDGKLQAVREAIDAGAALDAADALGFTPLMHACDERQAAVAELLIQRGAKLDVTALNGETALSIAMVRCASIAELLVLRGVLGRPLRVPGSGELLAPSDCDVCTRYPDAIDPKVRWSHPPVTLAWLDVISEQSFIADKTEFVERTLRCTLCATRYKHLFAREDDSAEATFPDVSQSINRYPSELPPDPPTLPALLLGALFVSEDGRLAYQVVRGDGVREQRAAYLTTIWAGIGGAVLLNAVHTRWEPATNAQSEHASERLGGLQAELDGIGYGNRYGHYVVCQNPDHAIQGETLWVAALPATPLAELRLFPEYSSSPYMPDDWDWQDGWWYPYSTFRPATAAERTAHQVNK